MAELALAILPLLLSVLEKYDRCLRPIEGYIKYSKRVNRFQHKFEIQGTIFYNQGQLLLEEAVDRGIAAQMLRDKAHKKWINKKLDGLLKDQLNTSRSSCIFVFHEVEQVLKRLEDWCSVEAIAIQEGEKVNRLTLHEGIILIFFYSSKPGSKAWLSLVKNKLKYAFSQDRLDARLVELKELNDSFLTLTSQTLKLERHVYRARESSALITVKVQELLMIQKTSRGLYTALGHACSTRRVHRTQFCLEAKATGPEEDLQVHFKLAFERCCGQSAAVQDVKFFTIESGFAR